MQRLGPGLRLAQAPTQKLGVALGMALVIPGSNRKCITGDAGGRTVSSILWGLSPQCQVKLNAECVKAFALSTV
jgi:hypothetical protein